MNRLDWMRTEATSNAHIRGVWTSYASVDIELWHADFRSLLDHISSVMCRLADRKGQVPPSFTRLHERAKKPAPDFVKKLGVDWVKLLQTARWYPRILWVRDELLHRGGQSLVFEKPSDGILFQVLAGSTFKMSITEPGLMFNPNVVYFERYAAYFVAHLLLFLEEFSLIAYRRLKIIPSVEGANIHFGFGTLMSWIDSTLRAIESVGVESNTSEVPPH